MVRWQYARLVQVREKRTVYETPADPAQWRLKGTTEGRRPTNLDAEPCHGKNLTYREFDVFKMVVITELHELCCTSCRRHPYRTSPHPLIPAKQSANHENCCSRPPMDTTPPTDFRWRGEVRSREVTTRVVTFEDVAAEMWTVATALVEPNGTRTELEHLRGDEPAADPGTRTRFGDRLVLARTGPTIAEQAADTAHRELNRLGAAGWELVTEEVRNGIFGPEAGTPDSSDWIQRTFWLRRPSEE
ncbi:hypothetical protein AB0E59_17600 [Lentzea sp. NPDC034063]|uniref:hypothetical protein n=1 Tax=unclassified Lentzea TaxID=2643253 RepID=UPI0033D67D02